MLAELYARLLALHQMRFETARARPAEKPKIVRNPGKC